MNKKLLWTAGSAAFSVPVSIYVCFFRDKEIGTLYDPWVLLLTIAAGATGAILGFEGKESMAKLLGALNILALGLCFISFFI